ncbi:MAG: rhodanese-like domain-containing protein [Bacteroidota bacterium]
MNQKNSSSKLLAVFLALFVFTSYQALSQQNKNLTIYENHEQMVAAAKEVITEIPVNEFKTILDTEKPVVIDVRTSAEHEEDAIPGAVNIPRGVLEFKIDSEELWDKKGKSVPAKSDAVFVYCSSGSRGSLSAKALMQLGYENVRSIKGGWDAWHESYPELRE